jgi:HpcH/HpaI aldolase/citrate lyase family
MRPNHLKGKLKAGQPALGCSVMFPSPQIVEMLGHAGFDWVLLDCEHGSLSLADVEVMAMAADAVGITPIARPRSNSAADIQSVMDRGVMGVQVPHINSAADAARAVSAVKFGPGAGRGLAAGTRPDAWGLGVPMADFTTAANEQSLRAAGTRGRHQQCRRDSQGRGYRCIFHRAVGPVSVDGPSWQSWRPGSGKGDHGHTGKDHRRRNDRRDAGEDGNCRCAC